MTAKDTLLATVAVSALFWMNTLGFHLLLN